MKPIRIPDEWVDVPEYIRLRDAQAVWENLLQQIRFSKAPELREQARTAQQELEDARRAFDAATGEPKSAGMTQAVIDKVRDDFGMEQETEVLALLDKECGRNLPFMREWDAEALEPYRLGVLKLAQRDRNKLLEAIGAANIDWKDMMMTAYYMDHPLEDGI